MSDGEIEASEREQIAAAVWERTELTMVEVGEIVDRSQNWVSRACQRAAAGYEGGQDV